MNEETPIVKTTDDARQGVRVKGMTTVLAASVAAAAIGMLIVGLIVARG